LLYNKFTTNPQLIERVQPLSSSMIRPMGDDGLRLGK